MQVPFIFKRHLETKACGTRVWFRPVAPAGSIITSPSHSLDACPAFLHGENMPLSEVLIVKGFRAEEERKSWKNIPFQHSYSHSLFTFVMRMKEAVSLGRNKFKKSSNVMSRTCLFANPSLKEDKRVYLKGKYDKALSKMLCVNKDYTSSDLPNAVS